MQVAADVADVAPPVFDVAAVSAALPKAKRPKAESRKLETRTRLGSIHEF